VTVDRRHAAALAVFCGLVAGPGLAGAHEAHRGQAGAPDPARSAYAFPLPQPGTYRLPVIRQASAGRILDEQGRDRDLADLLDGRIVVLAFIYTQCGDVCPTASARLAALQDLATGDPAISARMRLVSMSFDPDHDTPAVMTEYAAQWRSRNPKAPDWPYVTTAGRAALEPILRAYDQSVMRKPDSDGGLYHILRVFLIDASGRIRNIYSLDFLDPDLVLNDIRTVLMDRDPDGRSASRRE
jgi:cytochrome oxidase Cu insertion factor (SCO1/SenC/PrrC family)